MFNRDEIGAIIYCSGDGINVYCNKEKETITVNRSEMGIAESYFTYFLKEDKMAKWLWVKKEHTRTAFDEGERASVSGATGCVEKKQAKDFLIKKIVISWKKKGPYSFNVNADELEAALRKEFLS